MVARVLLLALPLKKGVIKAKDPILEGATSIFEKITLFFGVGVFVGVSAEVWLAYSRFPDTTNVGHWGPVYADMLVAIGVAGEIWFAFRASRCSGELTRRSKDRLADATTLAALAASRSNDAISAAAHANDELAKAQVTLGTAIERAAKAEENTERLKASNAWRTLTPDERTAIKMALDASGPPASCSLRFCLTTINRYTLRNNSQFHSKRQVGKSDSI